MAKLPRVTQKIFAQNSDTNDVTVFGTAKNGNDAVFTKDISQIMNSDAFSQGWGSATLTDDAPFQEDMNGVQLALSQQLAYFFENGMPEWDENTTYYANTSFCQVNGVWYQSLTDNNIGNNPVNDTTNWYKIDLDKLTPDLSNLSAPGLDKINQSKALETGSVSSDADVYADIQKYAHSTFDKSKFEVVGTPTITDDGIASGFGTIGNILTVQNTGNLNINTAKSFRIVNKIYTKNAMTSWGYWMHFENKSHQNFSFGINKGLYEVNWFDTVLNKQASIQYSFTEEQVPDGTEIYSDVEYDGTTVKLLLYLNGKLISNKSLETTLEAINPTTLDIGNYSLTYNNLFQGSIDLKSVAIWVDGVPVFSGNKTGIDIIKPDDYEVVGTPTITDDGIVSGFSSSSYVQKSINLITNNLVITGKTIIDSSQSVDIIFSTYPSSTSPTNYIDGLRFQWQPLNNTIRFAAQINGVDSNIIPVLSVNIENRALLEYKLTLKSGNSSFEYSINGVKQPTYTSATTWDLDFNITSIRIGAYANLYCTGSIDLNSIQIWVDGNLIYQPCLKIPYTLSKTGSKIVDAAYRDRVQDMYEQYGYAPYYTIDEENENFSLPMGEIYGMINRGIENLSGEKANIDFSNVTKPYVTETYTDETTWYRIYSDDWCEQGGALPQVGGYGRGTINFSIPFKDTNYGISVTQGGYNSDATRSSIGITNILTDSITIGFASGTNTNGRWFAYGYKEAD